MTIRISTRWITLMVLAFLLWTTGSVQALPPADDPAPQGQVGPAAVVSPLLQYQGRLTDPATGDPVADGTYQISFRLYNVDVGGSPLWTETEDLPVGGGLFSNVLGDSTPLDPALFGGQMLWLGIKVGADAEAAPRQPVLPVAYALSLVPGAVVGGPILVAGDLEVTGNLLGTHASNPSAHHTRYSDNEAWNAVLSNDGPGSGLNADLLDGSHASSFASSSHSHSGLLLKTTVLSVNCSTLNPFITSYRKITDVGSFTKQESGSTLEITFNGRIYAATMDGTGAVFELRVDDAATTNGRARASLRSSEAGGGGIQASMTGIFTGLGAGSHTVSVWVAGAFNGGTSAYVDPGCWGSDHVVIKEFK